MRETKSSVQRFFTEHAAGYANSPSFSHGPDIDALLRSLNPARTDVALDVATGTGFTTIALASLVRSSVGIDITPGMLREARMLARDRRVTNVKFEKGDALNLRWPPRSFDIVTTRRATHHFADVPDFLREARRVLKPGGRLGIVDMSPPEGAERFTNKVEKLRDSSHVRAFSPRKWESLVEVAGFELVSSECLQESLTLAKWLYPVGLGGEEEGQVRAAWGSSSARVRRLLKAKFTDDSIASWTKQRIVLVARPKNA